MALSDIERKVTEFIVNDDLNGLKAHFALHKINIDILDEHGLTPLTHACFNGNYEISQYLLDQGADVNTSEHEYRYSALHFAALSGNAKLCQLLLDAGAKSRVNSVGRTAPQMAAFVGNHQCVAIINNYIPKSEIDYYTVIHGLEHEPKLDPSLSSALHKLIMQVNIHPVRIALSMQPTLCTEAPSVMWVLELMSQKQMTRGAESNEIISFKLHYLSRIIGEIIKTKPTEQSGKQMGKEEVFIRRILKPGNGEKYMNTVIVESVREFPFRESTLFRQMVSSLASGNDAPSPLSVVGTAINGQRGFYDNIKCCATCEEETATKKCSKCKQVQYCDRECQRLHWFVHKKECNRNSDENNSINNKMESIKINQD